MWALDVRHLVAHRTRLVLSVLGIAVGVALAVAVGSLGTSVTGSLEAIAQATASKANIEIRPNGNVGLAPDLLGRVRDVDGVVEAGATVESYVQLRNGDRQTRTLVIGIDSGVLAMAPRAVDASTVETSDPFGLIMPEPVASELGARRGDKVEITTPNGWRTLPIGAVLDDASAARSRVVVGTVGVLQPLLGRGAGYDAIYVQAADPETALARIDAAVGSRARVGPPAFRSDQLQQLLAAATASFNVGTIVALFVGAFLVYNTMAMAAVERIQEAALLRAVGAKRRQVFALFVAEGGLLGVVGSALGVGGGLLLASRLLAQRGGALEDIYPVQISTLSISPRVLVGAGVAGVVASVVAAYLPARRISRADPAPSLGPAGAFEDPTRGPRRLVTAVAIVLALGGAVLTIASMRSGSQGATLLGFAVTFAGIALLIPIAVPAIARVVFGWLSGRRALTHLASGELLRSPGRTAFTAGAVLLSLALVVGFSIAQSSFTRAFDIAFEDIISTDLYVRSPTWRIFGSDVPLDDGLAKDIERVPGVAAAWPFRLMPATFEDRPLLVLAYDLDKYARFARLEGDARADVHRQAAAVRRPNTILATPSFLTQLGYRVGDEITLPTPTGSHRLTLGGTLDDPSAVNPEIIFDHDTFKRVWGSGGADTFAVVAEDRDDVDRVRERLADRFVDTHGLRIDTKEQYLDLLSSSVRSVQQLIGSVQLVAVIVAALGLANTLLISTFERRRDLGVLRAVGMLRRQVRRMVALEALLLGALGVLLAWGLGTLIGLGMYAFVRSQLGLGFGVVFPPMGYAGAAVLGIAAALAASIYPADRAARLDVVAALQYE